MEKMTKLDYYNRILAYAHEEDKEFLLHEMALVEKKNASRSNKPNAKQTANVALAETLCAEMESGKAYTISELKGLVSELAEANPQKMTALVRILIKNGSVTRSEEKGKAYFTKGE